jgi:hypothetical protein
LGRADLARRLRRNVAATRGYPVFVVRYEITILLSGGGDRSDDSNMHRIDTGNAGT